MAMKTNFIIILITIAFAIVSCIDDDFSSSTYNKLTREEKFNKIWSKVTEERVPYGWYSKITLIKLFFLDLKPTMEYKSDAFPSGRQKLIHSVGTVGMVEFKATDDTTSNPYSGVFKGCSHVILRMSVAKEPDESKKTANGADDNFVPGFGIKFLRDGVPSGNMVAMYSVNGQASWNFFKNEFSNHIAKAEGVAGMLIEKKFSTVTQYTVQVGLKDMATYGQDGHDYSNNLKFPYKIIYRPTPEAKALFTDYWSSNYLPQLESIPVDFVLYDVLALDGPLSNPVKIGELITRTKQTRSKWGDKTLFFRHGYMDDDFAFHPEWLDPQILENPEFRESFKAKYGFEHP